MSKNELEHLVSFTSLNDSKTWGYTRVRIVTTKKIYYEIWDWKKDIEYYRKYSMNIKKFCKENNINTYYYFHSKADVKQFAEALRLIS